LGTLAVALALLVWLRRRGTRAPRPHIGNTLSPRAAMPSYAVVMAAFTTLLAERGLPEHVHWFFEEDWRRMQRPDGAPGIAIFPRPAKEAERIARVALERLRFHRPIALVAYALDGDRTLVGLQADVFTADEIYKPEWDIHFHIAESV